MKTFKISLVVALLLLMTGCTENTVTNDSFAVAQSNSIIKTEKDKREIRRKAFDLLLRSENTSKSQK